MTLIWPFNATQSQMSRGKLKDHKYMIYYAMVFHAKFNKMLHLVDV